MVLPGGNPDGAGAERAGRYSMNTATQLERTPGSEPWPALPLVDGWEDTYETVHRWTQMVGKTRLMHSPMVNHWWHVTLYVTPLGLTTSSIPYGTHTFEVEFDFDHHLLIVRTSRGEEGSMVLTAEPVASFYREYVALLRSLDIEPKIWPVPRELNDAIPFTQDHTHASYDSEAVHRWFRATVQADRVMKAFRGRFLGKCSPVQFWWGAFDLACTRFSGRTAPKHPGGVPNCPDFVQEEAYSHECISAGFWPGGGPVREASFYAYAYPEPSGLFSANVGPRSAFYHPVLREFVLPYEAVRTAPDPDGVLLEFLETTYDAAADLAGWDRAALSHA